MRSEAVDLGTRPDYAWSMPAGEKDPRLLVARYVMRRVALSFLVLAAAWLAYTLRGVLLPIVLAFLVAYALDPIVKRLERWRIPRPMAAIGVMGGLLTLVVVALMFLIPYFVDEFTDAAHMVSSHLRNAWEEVDPWMWQHAHVHVPSDWISASAQLEGTVREHAQELVSGLMPALFGTLNVVLVIAGMMIVPVFAVYLLMDFDVIVERSRVLLPRRHAAFVTDVAREIHHTLGKYFRGQLLASLILGTLYAIGLRIIGLRLGIAIGLLTGALAFIPYVGSAIGFTLALSMALLEWQGPQLVLGTLIVMLTVQTLDGMLVTPRVVGGSVGLKPIEVLITMMAVGTLFGFIGILLAMPIGAVVKILISRGSSAYLQSRYYRDIPSVLPTPTPFRSPLLQEVSPPSRSTASVPSTRVTLQPIHVTTTPTPEAVRTPLPPSAASP